jgi:flagellar export protein FliJ
MARSNFRFRRILRLKTQLRKVAQDEIARIRQDLAHVEKGIAESEVARIRNLAAARQAAGQGCTAGELRLYDAYDRGQQARGRALRVEADALGEVVEAQRAIVLERRREERQFECLEDRQSAREGAAQARGEASVQDDLARRMRRALRATLGDRIPPGARGSDHPLSSRRGSGAGFERGKRERRS